MSAKALVLVLCAAVVSGLPEIPAAASDGPAVRDLRLEESTVAAGTPLRLAGAMTVTEQPAARLWTDATMPGELLSFQYPTEPLLDLVEGSVRRSRPGDPFIMSIKVAAAPAETGPKPYMRFRWPFHLGDIWYFVTFNAVQSGAGASWQGRWYYCRLALGSACVHGTTPPFPVTFDTETRTFTGAIPLRDMAAVQPDGVLVQDTMRPFSAQYPPESGYAFPVLTWRQDSSAAFAPHDVPIESAVVGIAPAGADPGDVAFPYVLPLVVSDGSLDVGFGGEVPTDDLAPGAYDVWVKTCFGPCTVEVLPITVT